MAKAFHEILENVPARGGAHAHSPRTCWRSSASPTPPRCAASTRKAARAQRRHRPRGRRLRSTRVPAAADHGSCRGPPGAAANARPSAPDHTPHLGIREVATSPDAADASGTLNSAFVSSSDRRADRARIAARTNRAPEHRGGAARRPDPAIVDAGDPSGCRSAGNGARSDRPLSRERSATPPVGSSTAWCATRRSSLTPGRTGRRRPRAAPGRRRDEAAVAARTTARRADRAGARAGIGRVADPGPALPSPDARPRREIPVQGGDPPPRQRRGRARHPRQRRGPADRRHHQPALRQRGVHPRAQPPGDARRRAPARRWSGC